jgi:hypothetical protein
MILSRDGTGTVANCFVYDDRKTTTRRLMPAECYGYIHKGRRYLAVNRRLSAQHRHEWFGLPLPLSSSPPHGCETVLLTLAHTHSSAEMSPWLESPFESASTDESPSLHCVPCNKDLPLAAFQCSAIVNRVRRCRSCATALVRASARRERQRNPKRAFVARVQQRTRKLHRSLAPSWVGTAGVVQAVLEAAGWRSALGGSVRSLVLVQKRGATGEWTPRESVCVTAAEAVQFAELPTATGH